VNTIHQVFSQLTTSHASRLRLASKYFAEIGKEHLVDDVCLFRHPRSIQKVIEISRSGEWAPKVRTIVFENVARPEWDQIPFEPANAKFSKGSNRWMKKSSNLLRPT
jgi:hypothetical protein